MASLMGKGGYREMWKEHARKAARLRLFLNASKDAGVEASEELKAMANEQQGFPYTLEDYPSYFPKAVQMWRFKIFRTFEDPSYSVIAQSINMVVLVLILFSTVAFVLETQPELAGLKFWEISEMVVVACFSFEYVVRLFCAPFVWKFIRQPLNVVDLLAILPFYIELGLGGSDNAESLGNLRVLRAVRLMRVFRVFKLSKHSTHFSMFSHTLQRSSDALTMLLFIIIITMVVFAGAIYYVEKSTWDPIRRVFIRPDNTIVEIDHFESIPAAFWWAIVTMTTVGYGDAVPVTPVGKFIAAVAMLTGVLVVALPVTIVGSNFTEVYTMHKLDKEVKSEDFIKDDSLSNSGYADVIVKLCDQRRMLVGLYLDIEGTLSTLRDESGSRPWNTIEQAMFDNLLHDMTSIETFLSSFPERIAFNKEEAEKAMNESLALSTRTAEDGKLKLPGR